MHGSRWRLAILAAVAIVGLAAVASLPAIPQDPAYHRFAECQRQLGIPCFWTVVTNIPFVLVGIVGLMRAPTVTSPAIRAAHRVLAAGAVAIGAGSAYYHLAPSTPALFWDRLPITVAVAAVFAMVVADRLSERAGWVALWTIGAAGVGAVMYWRVSELAGHGDLRAYAAVQFLPVVLVPLMLVLYRARELSTAALWAMLVCYGVAKLAEYLDGPILDVIGVMSGHSVKHLLAAVALHCALISVPGARRGGASPAPPARLRRRA